MSKLLILSLSLILPLSCFANTKLILQTSDNQQIECTQEQKEILMLSKTIKNMFKDLGDEEDAIIPVSEISEKTFNQIMSCLKPLADMEELKADLKVLEGKDQKDKESEIETKELQITAKLQSYPEDDLYHLIQATSYFDIARLLDYACTAWSNSYELNRLKDGQPSFGNQEVIKTLTQSHFPDIKDFFTQQYFENHTYDVKKFKSEGPIASVYYSPNGTQIASILYDNTIYIRDAITGERLKTLECHAENSIAFACYNLDGTQFAYVSRDNTIHIWDTITWQHLDILTGHTGNVNSICYSPDGKQLASASDDNTIRIWDSITGEYLKTLNGHTDCVNFACYSPDSAQLASASDDNTIRIWNSITGEYLKTLNGHTNLIQSTCYSPDGAQLASFSDDITIRIWNPITGQCLYILKDHAGFISSICYSPNGAQLASVSSASSDEAIIRMWDTHTGECLQTLNGHTCYISSICYSPDSTQLASASNDKTICIWDTITGERLYTLKRYKNLIASIFYSLDGNCLISASWDGTINILDTRKPVENLEYKQLILHKLFKTAIKNNERVNLSKNKHLSSIFNSLPCEQRAFLNHITPLKLPLKKKISLQLYNYKKSTLKTFKKLK